MVEEGVDDLRQLHKVVLERAETLVELHLDKVPWNEVRHLSLRDLLKAIFLDRDKTALPTQNTFPKKMP